MVLFFKSDLMAAVLSDFGEVPAVNEQLTICSKSVFTKFKIVKKKSQMAVSMI